MQWRCCLFVDVALSIYLFLGLRYISRSLTLKLGISMIRPKKIKGLFSLLAWKLGGSVGRSFFFFLNFFIHLFIFFKIQVQKQYNIIHVCESLGMQSLRIGLILVLEGVVFHYIWLKYLFGTVTINSDNLFWIFLFKNTKLSIKGTPTCSSQASTVLWDLQIAGREEFGYVLRGDYTLLLSNFVSDIIFKLVH